MTVPQFELPDSGTPKPRMLMGWVLLAGIFALLIAMQTAGYFLHRSGEPAYTLEEETLRSAVFVKEFKNRLAPSVAIPGPENATKNGSSDNDQFMAILDGAASRLEPYIKRDRNAALLFAEIRTEQGAHVPPAAIATLKLGTSKFARAAAEIYGSDKLTPDRAQELASQMTKNRFEFVLAGIHALEKAGDKQARKRAWSMSKLAVFNLTQFAEIALLGIGGVLLVGYTIARKNGKWPPLGHPAGKLTKRQGDQYAFRVVQIILVFVLSGIIAGLLTGKLLSNVGLSMVATVLSLIGAWFVLRQKVEGSAVSADELGIRTNRFFKKAFWGACGVAANLPLLTIVGVISYFLFRSLPPAEHPLEAEFAGKQDTLSWIAYILTAAVLAPIFEEVCFRGMLLPALESLFDSPFKAIVVSSLLFGAIHPTGIPAWLPLATIGAMAAMLTYQTRSLVPAIVLHMLNNLFLVLKQLSAS